MLYYKIIQRIHNWFKDSYFRRLFKNAGILLAGNITTNFLDLVSLAITARALGPEKFGVLVLIQAYVRVVDSLLNFQSWQAITKYGADSLVQKRFEDFKSLIKFGTFLDASSALLGTFVAATAAYNVGHWQGWSDDTVMMAVIFSFIIMFNLVGTPTAILRLFNCFGLLSKTRVTAATIKVICLAIAFYFNGDLWIFLLVWMSMHILDYSLILGAGWYAMNSQGFHKTMAAGLKDISKKFSGIWKFVVSTNLSSSIRLVAMEGDILLVGALIGTKAAGLYKVARQFGMIPGRFADPLQQAVYPDMAKLWATGSAKKFRSYILRIGLLAGMGGITIWIFFVIGGKLVLSLTVGKEFIPAHNLLIVYMIGLVIFMFGVAFRPAVLSMEHAERILIIYTGSTIVYSIVLILLLTQIGVMGASIAQVVFHTCWFFAMAISIRSFIRKHLMEINKDIL